MGSEESADYGSDTQYISHLKDKISEKDAEIELLSKLCVEGVNAMVEKDQELKDVYDALRLATEKKHD